MIIDDEYIIRYFKDKDINIYNINKLSQECLEYLQNRYIDSSSLKEIVYRIIYKIDIYPCCPVCGNKLNFYGKPNLIFAKTCSKKCGAIYSDYKRKNTVNKKYGVEYIGESKEIRQKIKDTCLEKYNTTCYLNSDENRNKLLEKYGTKYPLQNLNIRKKIIDIFNQKYGANSPMNSEIVKDKQQQTNIKRYNVNCVRKNKEIKDKIVRNSNYSKKINNTFNTSLSEDLAFLYISLVYPDTIRQYSSTLYPFNCDFYIPSLDLYIEYQGSWTHGFKPYEGSKEDNNKLDIWKSKNKQYYINAIKTWTIRDVNKRNIAKENNLNFIEFWNLNELIDWCNF